MSVSPDKLSDTPTTPRDAGPAAIFREAKPSREDVAAFLFANPGRVLRGVRAKVNRLETGRRGSLAYLSTDDLLATIIVRVDRAVQAGELRTAHEAEFWAYIHVIGENAVLELLRSGKHGLRTGLDLGTSKPAPTDAAAVDAVTALLAVVPTDSDRGLLCFKARGASYALIAAATGRSEQAVRKQWSKLRTFLRRTAPAS